MVELKSVADKRRELRQAVQDLRERGLYPAAKWAAEQLVGLPECGEDRQEHAPVASTSAADGGESDAYLLARTHFDLKEYRRCAYLLQGLRGPKVVFLRCYATYLAGERRKEEARVERGPGAPAAGAAAGGGGISAGAAGAPGKQRPAVATNPELETLEEDLRRLHGGADGIGNAGGDAFTAYLYGVVLLDREKKEQALRVLLASVRAYPCNWAAWQALQLLCGDMDAVARLDLPLHWARDFFMVAVCLELQANTDALQRLQALAPHFPHSEWVASCTATAQYNLRNFEEAQELFEDLLERDPYRIEGMDGYSNVLYVKEQFAKLSHLAHRVAGTDKYRPETCCIIGNYYSLRGQHEKAVLYFRRALRLNPSYLSAWTLMGHEYVEMKNPAAAIEAYRRAVDLNPRDYRAWYGLGQTYELVQEPYYALYYFRRATELRPADARMWCAMGQCYESEQLRQNEAAIRCYRRAVANGDREGIALHKLARLHEQLGQPDDAAHYYRLNVERMDADGLEGSDLLDALTFLAHYCKDNGDLQQAEEHCTRLLDFGGPQYKERAKALLREVRVAQEASSTPPPAFATPMAAAAPPSPGGSSDLDMSPMT